MSRRLIVKADVESTTHLSPKDTVLITPHGDLLIVRDETLCIKAWAKGVWRGFNVVED